MSHTFAARPSVGRTRGRGQSTRGTGRGTRGADTRRQSGGRGQPMDPYSDEGAMAGAQPGGAGRGRGAAEEERVQRGSGFTMFAPKEEKRQAIAAQAKKEEEAYNRYKESRRVNRVSYVGTVGGGPPAASSMPNKTPVKSKTLAERRADDKRRQDAEFQKKKDLARQQTERNAQRSADRNRRLDEDKRRKNEEFLARLERQNKSGVSG